MEPTPGLRVGVYSNVASVGCCSANGSKGRAGKERLTVNTGTTIVTFLMVFLIQNTQNRDSVAVQLKLDELIRSHREAHNWLLDLEKLPEADLERMRKTFGKLAEKAREGGTATEEFQRHDKAGSPS